MDINLIWLGLVIVAYLLGVALGKEIGWDRGYKARKQAELEARYKGGRK